MASETSNVDRCTPRLPFFEFLGALAWDLVDVVGVVIDRHRPQAAYVVDDFKREKAWRRENCPEAAANPTLALQPPFAGEPPR
ncbi:MAG: hypothetical protein HY903_08340 [Deltaproteobacteria bacterium]|nr:hypothetical protein [Deltaproteobacteria bacterium]